MSDPLPTATVPRQASPRGFRHPLQLHASVLLIYKEPVLRVTNVLADQPGWAVKFGQRLLPIKELGIACLWVREEV